MSVDTPEPTPRPDAPALSPEHAQALLDLATRLKDGGTAARPKHGRLTLQEASQKSRAYWATLSPTERRIRTLSARIGVGEAARRELDQLLAQLQAHQQDTGEGRP